MSEKQTDIPILQDGMTIAEEVVLGNMLLHPGFKIFAKLANAACEAATRRMVQTNPEDADYNRLIAVRQQRARDYSEFAKWLFESAEWHAKVGSHQQAEADEELNELVQQVNQS